MHNFEKNLKHFFENSQNECVPSKDSNQPGHRGPDKLSVQLGIYPTRFSSIAFFPKQLLNNIFFPHMYF